MNIRMYFAALTLIVSMGIHAIPFKLLNTGAKDIPLIIPGVMNPNLSPFSSSGVDLKVGQKIYFKHKGKRHILFVVDDSLAEQSINVNKLIQQRKSQLGLELEKSD